MAALREMVLPRQESSHCNWSGARRSGIGRAKGIGIDGALDKCRRLVYVDKALRIPP